mmetsp:Transcript_128428/g.221891  ORF Transcript_128428/g.221891 Transcript_128428/m.221891 type:complete len:321 (+) Transcript_128428:593-1555(+)
MFMKLHGGLLALRLLIQKGSNLLVNHHLLLLHLLHNLVSAPLLLLIVPLDGRRDDLFADCGLVHVVHLPLDLINEVQLLELNNVVAPVSVRGFLMQLDARVLLTDVALELPLLVCLFGALLVAGKAGEQLVPMLHHPLLGGRQHLGPPVVLVREGLVRGCPLRFPLPVPLCLELLHTTGNPFTVVLDLQAAVHVHRGAPAGDGFAPAAVLLRLLLHLQHMLLLDRLVSCSLVPPLPLAGLEVDDPPLLRLGLLLLDRQELGQALLLVPAGDLLLPGGQRGDHLLPHVLRGHFPLHLLLGLPLLLQELLLLLVAMMLQGLP